MTNDKGSICIVGWDFPPTIGGLSDHTKILADLFFREGWRVVVVAAARQTEAVPYEIRGLQSKSWTAILGTVRESMCERVLVQYVPHMWGRGGVALDAATGIWRLAREFDTTVWLHELQEELRLPITRVIRSLAQRLQLAIIQHGAQKAVITNDYYRGLLNNKIQKKVLQVPVFSSLCLYPESRRTDAASSTDLHLVVFGGGRDLRKTLPYLVDGLKNVGVTWSLQLFGAASVEEAEWITKIAKESSVEDLVRYTPNASQSELVEHLSAADIFVSPYFGGPSGRRTTIAAALQFGLPVIALDGRQRQKEFEHMQNVYLVENNSADAWQAAIRTLVQNPELAVTMRREAKNLYSTVFHHEITFRKVFNYVRGCNLSEMME